MNLSRWLYAIPVSALMLVSGCKQSQGGPQVNRVNTLIKHNLSDPQGLNPFLTTDASSNYIHILIFDRLIDLDYATLQLKPVVCDSLPTVSESKDEFTFTIRKDVVFADGKPLTAKDVVFSFKALMNPYCESAPKRAELHKFSDCYIKDDQTVVFKCSTPGPFNLNKLAMNFFVLPKHIYDPNNLTDKYSVSDAIIAAEHPEKVSKAADDAMHSFATAFSDEKFMRTKGSVVGSGRYLFEEWVTGQTIILVKNPNYWNASSDSPFAQRNMDTIVFKTINDLETALTALKNGEIDLSDQFKPDQITTEKMSGPEFDARFTKKIIPYPSYVYLGWNARIKGQPHKTFFGDKRVRMAMSLLTNVDEIIEKVMYGTGQPISSMVFYERPEYNKSLQIIRYDQDQAIKLLDDAGWVDSDGDGIRDKVVNGKKTPFEFTMYYNQGNKVREQIALIMKEHLKQVGIIMEVASLDWSVFLEKSKNHEMDAWVGGWAYDSDEQEFYSLFHSSQINNSGYNYTSYANAEADSVMEAILIEWDMSKRIELHKRIQEILYRDQPYTLLYANTQRIAFNNRLKNENWYSQRPCYDLPQFRVTEGSIP